jgi:hypothetical protein|tara:strand:+ start:3207 stop:3674 length:468 start_codon:yes stop_codon:yes gene_type:complete
MKELIFKEKQKFTQKWLWLILIILPLLITISPIDLSSDPKLSYLIILMSLSPMILFYFIELRVMLSNKGLQYQFFPFHLKSYTIKLDEITSFEELTYSPIKDYGGWGIRYGFKGKAYNVSGNKGVKIYLKNGKNILFGSKKSNELALVLEQIMKQ